MSKRATDFAADKFPFRYDAHGDVINFEQTVLLQGVCRIGYMQAEKDLALTWEDIRTISLIEYDTLNGDNPESTPSPRAFYEEVLRKFNKAREEQK